MVAEYWTFALETRQLAACEKSLDEPIISEQYVSVLAKAERYQSQHKMHWSHFSGLSALARVWIRNCRSVMPRAKTFHFTYYTHNAMTTWA